MSDVSREVVFDVPIERAYAVIGDFAKYPKFLKDVKSVKVLKSGKTSAEVLFKLKLFKEIEYTLHFTLKAPTRITWSLKSGTMFRKNSGSWTLKSLGKNATEAIYTLDVELGLFVPSMVSKMLVAQSLPDTLRAFKSRIEK
jgi:ribosome-associated toxin RatA of RatAB toxin-antitoxin module